VRERATFRLATLPYTTGFQIPYCYPMNLTFTLLEDRDCNVYRNVWIVHSSAGIILKVDPRRRSSAARAWRLEPQTSAAVSAETGADNRALFPSNDSKNREHKTIRSAYDKDSKKWGRQFIGGCLWTWRLENHWTEREYATEQRKEHSHNNRQWKDQR